MFGHWVFNECTGFVGLCCLVTYLRDSVQVSDALSCLQRKGNRFWWRVLIVQREVANLIRKSLFQNQIVIGVNFACEAVIDCVREAVIGKLHRMDTVMAHITLRMLSTWHIVLF